MNWSLKNIITGLSVLLGIIALGISLFERKPETAGKPGSTEYARAAKALKKKENEEETVESEIQ